MTFKELIDELYKRSIQIDFSGGKIKYRGPEENITSEIISGLKQYKGEVIKYFWSLKKLNLMPINPVGSRIPFVLVHGDRANYLLSDYLGKDLPFFGFFHIGSEGEQIPFNTVEEFADHYIKQLELLVPKGPIILSGFSFGGIVAYEMALMLQKKGYEILCLIVIDSLHPAAKELYRKQPSLYLHIRRNIISPLYQGLLKRVKRLICTFYFTIKKPLIKQLRKFYVLDKYYIVWEKYLPGKFDGKMVLYRAEGNKSSYEYLGWDKGVDDIQLELLPGFHETMFLPEEGAHLLKESMKIIIENHSVKSK